MGTSISAEILQRRLDELDLSARKASVNAGLPDNFVGNILRGEKVDPGGSRVIALCDVLGIKDVRELYDAGDPGEKG